MSKNTELIERLYLGFNARKIDDVFVELADDVRWANGMDGGHLRGHEAVRAYWTQQWTLIDPHVDPRTIAEEPEGKIAVDVHQVVRDLEGALLLDEIVRHVFLVEGAKVTRFDIESPSGLSAVVHEA